MPSRNNNQVEHYATTEVIASADQIFAILSRLEDYPRIFSFVEDVTCYETDLSHWRVNLLGTHRWEAINTHWEQGRQVGWRVTSGWGYDGRIHIQPLFASDRVHLHMFLRYTPFGGLYGGLVDSLLLAPAIRRSMSAELRRFATILENAPESALNPSSHDYIFANTELAAREREAAARRHRWAAPVETPSASNTTHSHATR